MVKMNMMASLCLFAVLVSFSTTHPAHSFLISQHGLITSKFPEEKSNIATRNRNIKKNGIIINNISIRLQSSYQREPQNEASGGSSNINNEDEGKELTLYEILRATPNDTRSEIKSQYIALARISHPDAQLSKEKGEGGIDEDAVVDFQQIAEAWRTLGNAASRRKYDRKLGALEWGEKAQRLTNERLDQAVPIALNFLRRTTAVGQAIATGFSSSSMSTSTSSPATENEDDTSNNNNVEINNDNDKDNTNTISNIDDDEVFEMDHEQVADEVVSNGSKQNKATETTLTDTFISAIEAGKQAGRDVDTLEINENSFELHERAKNEEEKAKHVFEELDSIKEKRLFATLQTTEFALSSNEAEEVLERLHSDDNFSFANRSMKKAVIIKEIQSLRNAETQFTEKLESYTEVDREWNEWLIKQEEAKENLAKKKNREIEARKILDTAQKMVVEAKVDMVKVSSTLRGVEQEVRKRAQEMDRVSTTLSRKQERVRNALRRKTELLKGGIQVEYITEQEVIMLRRKEVQLFGESRQIATMVSRLQSRANTLKKRADALEQRKK